MQDPEIGYDKHNVCHGLVIIHHLQPPYMMVVVKTKVVIVLFLMRFYCEPWFVSESTV